MASFTLRIDALAHGGAGVGRTAEGKVVFVPATAPGDTVVAEMVSDKGNYAQARLIEVADSSPKRVEAACPHFGRCGGCQWQHIAYPTQLAAKQENVRATLVRIGGMDENRAKSLVDATVPCKEQQGYRNKIELATSNDGQGRLILGFAAAQSHDVFAVPSCPLAHKAVAGAPRALQGALRYLQGQSDLKLFRVGLRHSERTRSLEVALWTAPGPFPRAAVAKTLRSALPATSIVRVMAESGASRKVKGVEALHGPGHWTETLSGFALRASAPSFFQVNSAQAETLQSLVIEGLALGEGARVADLYAGVGTFTLPLAARAGSAVAVESAGSAVRDLRRNAEAAGLDVEVVGGDSARELPELGPLDALVVDPPRSGLAQGVAERIASARPAKLAYVSCDPASWARDVARLARCGYRLEKATPVDLFPQTYHTEVASIFARC